MFDENYGTNMAERITIVLGHLQMESIYLDTVIESGREIQSILRQQRERVSGDQSDEPHDEEATPGRFFQQERNERIRERLAELRSEISTRFLPVLEARKKLPGILKQFDPACAEAPSLTALSFLVAESYRTRLKELRDEIRSKLNQVYSITMGNQTVLIYTLNYYDQLLNGNADRPDYYNANGQTTSQNYGTNFLKTNC